MRKQCTFLRNGEITEGFVVAERSGQNEIDIEVNGIVETHTWAGVGGVTWVGWEGIP